MLYSMTGFGRAESMGSDRQVVAEIKSLNGKQFELATKLSPVMRPYELEVRGMLNGMLLRGTIDLTVSIRQEGASRPMAVNMPLARFYHQSMQQLVSELGIDGDNILSTLMRMPEVVAPDQEVLPEDAWLGVRKVIAAAAESLMEHRRREGAALYNDLQQRVSNIERLHQQILPLEPARMERVRQRIQNAIQEHRIEKPDANRFEQELIYYIERSDFSEEKTRLTQHCAYFREMMGGEELSKGKMLGFILQEIGREINTLGSKANDAAIQQIVVQMKDELEKAKEQVLNIL